MSKKSSAQRAYEGYAAFTGGKTFDGRPMPTWTELPERIRQAWAAGLDAAEPSGDEFRCSALDDDDIDEAVGFAEDGEHPVVVVSPHTNEGIALTVKGAAILAATLQEALKSPFLPPSAPQRLRLS